MKYNYKFFLTFLNYIKNKDKIFNETKILFLKKKKIIYIIY
jgi:hypothetical protein